MPFYRMGAHMVHLNLGGKLRKNPPAPCCARVPAETLDPSFAGQKQEVRCNAMSTLLCDWPLEEGGTCDAPLCAEHGTEVGRDKHLCPIHLARRRVDQPELFE